MVANDSLLWGNSLLRCMRRRIYWNQFAQGSHTVNLLSPSGTLSRKTFLLAPFLEVYWHYISVYEEEDEKSLELVCSSHSPVLQVKPRSQLLADFRFQNLPVFMSLKIIHDVCVLCSFDWCVLGLRFSLSSFFKNLAFLAGNCADTSLGSFWNAYTV